MKYAPVESSVNREKFHASPLDDRGNKKEANEKTI